MASETAAFGWAFLAVWGGLAAYLVHLHLRAARVERDAQEIRRRLDESERVAGKPK